MNEREVDPFLDTPYALADIKERERRILRIDDPHVGPLNEMARRIRSEQGDASVPWFDPADGGISARILLLLESPGPRGANITGFVSQHNPDRTAKSLWELRREAGALRAECVVWNAVPWYLPGPDDHGTFRSPRTRDLQSATPWFHELLALLPHLQSVVLLGRSAQRAFVGLRLSKPVAQRVLGTWHTSALALNGRPERRVHVLAALREARRS